MKYLILTLLFVSCGTSEPNDPDGSNVDPYVLEARTTLEHDQDEYGFIKSSKCDGLTFSSLAAVGGLSVDILAAEGEPGQWFRTPDHNCFPEGRSKSDISRDALLALTWYATVFGHTGILEDIIIYGENNGFIMGRGDKSRTLLTPMLLNTMAHCLDWIGGKRFESYLNTLPVDPTPIVHDGFEGYNRVSHLLLRGACIGSLPDWATFNLKLYHDEFPDRPLMVFAHKAYTDGDFSGVPALIKGEHFVWFDPPEVEVLFMDFLLKNYPRIRK